MIQILGPTEYLFLEYARVVAASVVSLSLASVIFRILWELR